MSLQGSGQCLILYYLTVAVLDKRLTEFLQSKRWALVNQDGQAWAPPQLPCEGRKKQVLICCLFTVEPSPKEDAGCEARDSVVLVT